jgi:NlpC/P60 family.
MTVGETRAGVIATARSLKSQLKYSNNWVGATVAQLKARGAGDCSDFTQAVYGEHGYVIGGMSYDQATNGVEVASWRGARGGANAAFIAAQPKLKPADLIAMAIDSSRPGVISHVEIYIGNGLSIGHGGPGYGPTEHAITDYTLLQSATYWTARRIITDDTQEEEDMPTTKEIVNALLDAPIERRGGRTGSTTLRGTLAWLDANILDNGPQAAANKVLNAKLGDGTSVKNKIAASLTEIPGVSAEQVQKALDDALADLKITLTTSTETDK